MPPRRATPSSPVCWLMDADPRLCLIRVVICSAIIHCDAPDHGDIFKPVPACFGRVLVFLWARPGARDAPGHLVQGALVVRAWSWVPHGPSAVPGPREHTQVRLSACTGTTRPPPAAHPCRDTPTSAHGVPAAPPPHRALPPASVSQVPTVPVQQGTPSKSSASAGVPGIFQSVTTALWPGKGQGGPVDTQWRPRLRPGRTRCGDGRNGRCWGQSGKRRRWTQRPQRIRAPARGTRCPPRVFVTTQSPTPGGCGWL